MMQHQHSLLIRVQRMHQPWSSMVVPLLASELHSTQPVAETVRGSSGLFAKKSTTACMHCEAVVA
jgi:hypothetical protein